MKPSQRVGKNVAWMLVGGGLGRCCRCWPFCWPREDYRSTISGTFNYLLSFAIVFQFLTDFGSPISLARGGPASQ